VEACSFPLRRSGNDCGVRGGLGGVPNPLPHPGAARILRPTRAPRLVLCRQSKAGCRDEGALGMPPQPHSSGPLSLLMSTAVNRWAAEPGRAVQARSGPARSLVGQNAVHRRRRRSRDHWRPGVAQGPFGSISFANSGAGPLGEARVASRPRMVRTEFAAGPGFRGRGSVGGHPRCGRRAAYPPAPSG
jgi:hypothetical protein